MLQIIRDQLRIRAALLVPSMVPLIFVLMNLTAAVDQGRAFGSLSVGIADLGVHQPHDPFVLPGVPNRTVHGRGHIVPVPFGFKRPFSSKSAFLR